MTEPAGIIRKLVAGTRDDCDIHVEDVHVSLRHCGITYWSDGRTTVEDLGSTNGTWVRPAGKPVSPLGSAGVRVTGPMPLKEGMVVRIGRTDLTIPDHPLKPAAPPADARYTLDEASQVLAEQACAAHGHRFDHVVNGMTHDPVRIYCSRCGHSWDIATKKAPALDLESSPGSAGAGGPLGVAADRLGG